MSDTNPGFQPFGFAGGLYDGKAHTVYSFYQAADEAALTRLYGGIHHLPSIELGLMQGKCIGSKVNNLALKKESYLLIISSRLFFTAGHSEGNIR